MRKAILSLTLMLPLICCAVEAPSLEAAAALDVVTTAIGLHNGARELNPLGFGGTTVLKIALIPYVNSIEDEAQRKDTQNFLSSIFMGASVNNILAISHISPILSIPSAIITYNILRQK